MATNINTFVFLIIAGSIVPILFWLWFWLKEDPHPEPLYAIIITFLFGILSIAVILPLEAYSSNFFAAGSLALLTIWALIEEVGKYSAAYIASLLHKRDLDEPVDVMIYMIVVSLGFAALENSFFLYKIASSIGLHAALVNSGLRFMGATLLHILASSVVGFSIALAYCRDKFDKFLYTIVGLVVAVVLHTAFNLFIIKDNGSYTLAVFTSLWVAIIVLLMLFERVKKIVCTPNYPK